MHTLEFFIGFNLLAGLFWASRMYMTADRVLKGTSAAFALGAIIIAFGTLMTFSNLVVLGLWFLLRAFHAL